MASLPEGISLDIPDLVVSIEPRSEYIVTLQPVDEYRTVTLTTPVTTRATSIFVDRAQSASFSQTAITASYFDTALTVESSSYANLAATASYVETAQTASFVASASYSETASYSNTSEWDGLNSIPAGIISSSGQMADDISGSFTSGFNFEGNLQTGLQTANGTWSTGAALIAGSVYQGYAGSKTAGINAMGLTGPLALINSTNIGNTAVDRNEEWNGSTWSEASDNNISRALPGAAGTAFRVVSAAAGAAGSAGPGAAAVAEGAAVAAEPTAVPEAAG